MDISLLNNFLLHYSIGTTTNLVDLFLSTNHNYFEIGENTDKRLFIVNARNVETAKFSNKLALALSIFEYEIFIDSLPHSFHKGLERCDLLLDCNENMCFILGELKDRQGANSKKRGIIRRKAKSQLLTSLKTLWNVQTIQEHINTKTIKRCCYFNKQAASPSPTISAVSAFNRLPNTFPDGFKHNDADIESYGFEFYEYTGMQTLTIT